MSKFKVGDTVKCSFSTDYYEFRYGTITQVTIDSYYTVKWIVYANHKFITKNELTPPILYYRPDTESRVMTCKNMKLHAISPKEILEINKQLGL